MPVPKPLFRNFTATIWNYPDELPMAIDGDIISYFSYQEEKCPETGKLHLQGYGQLVSPLRSFKRVQRALGDPTAHIERMRGSLDDNERYCGKADTRVRGPWEIGVRKGKPKNTNMRQILELIQAGAAPSDIMEEFPAEYVRYTRGIEKMWQTVMKKKTRSSFRKVEVFVLWGESGTGKTRFAYDKHPDTPIFKLMKSGGDRVWFDGYENEPILIIDDFYGWIKYSKILEILDGHPLRCEVKGGSVQACWTTVYITSNQHPQYWYQKGLTPALKRRLTTITEMPDLVCEEVLTDSE